MNLSVAGALRVCVHEASGAVRAVETTNGQLSIDLIAKEKNEDGLHGRASANFSRHAMCPGIKCFARESFTMI